MTTARSPGLEPEAAIEQDRKRVIEEVKRSWRELSSEADVVPPLAEEAFAPLKSGNLSKRWPDELRNIVNRLAELRHAEPLGKDATPLQSLRLARRLVETSRERPPQQSLFDDTSRLAPLRAWPPQQRVQILRDSAASAEPATLAVPLFAGAIAAQQDEIDRIEEDRRQVVAAIERIVRLEQALADDQKGPDLAAVLNALARRGPDWLAALRAPSVSPTLSPIADWLEQALPPLREAAPPFVERLLALLEQRVRLQDRRDRLRQRGEQLRKGQELAGLLRDLAAHLPGLELPEGPTTIGEILKRAESAEQRTRPTSREAAKEVPEQSDRAEELCRALDRWVAVEQRAEAREAALLASTAYNHSAAVLDDALEALEAETKSKFKARHREAVLPAVSDVPQHLVEPFVATLNRVLVRFRLVEGIAPIRLAPLVVGTGRSARRTWRLQTAAGLEYAQLSTGQLAQLNIAWTIALHLALGDLLPHRVLLLDDLTTSLDQSELIPVCILLRQLAYARDPARRRQVFLTCHHEDLTNQLLDNLLPPGSGEQESRPRLKVLTFRGWDPGKGPDIVINDAIGGRGGATGEPARSFAELLGWIMSSNALLVSSVSRSRRAIHPSATAGSGA